MSAGFIQLHSPFVLYSSNNDKRLEIFFTNCLIFPTYSFVILFVFLVGVFPYPLTHEEIILSAINRMNKILRPCGQ